MSALEGPSLIDVVIPTWDRVGPLITCLVGLAEQTVPHTTYVVDNGSADGTVEAVRARFPGVQVVALPRNHGFGPAVNHGIRRGSAPFVVVLNNDAVAEPEFLERVVAPLRDGADAVAGVLLDASGSYVDAAGVVVDGGLAGYSHLHAEQPDSVLEAPQPTGPCGGAAAYRRTTLEALGSFDEEIFAYGEDVELALRLREAGASCVLAREARVRHLGSATLGHRSPAQLRLSGWARGYVLGRYRVAAPWVVLELVIGVADCVLQRSRVPLTCRFAGWRRGRALPARTHGKTHAAVGVVDGLRRRLASAMSTA